MKIRLEPFVPKDLEEIFSLEKKSFSKDIALSKEQMFAMIMHADVVCYCLKTEKNSLLAYILIRIDKIHHTTIILSMAVKKKYRQKKWGTRLVNFCKKLAQDLKADFIKLQIESNNKIAKIFFQKLGFQVTNKLDDFLKEKNEGLELTFAYSKINKIKNS